MGRRVGGVAAVLAAVVVAGVALWLLGRPGEQTPQRGAGPSVQSPEQESRPPPLRPTLRRQWPLGARLVRRTQLRDSPGGRVVTTLARRTEYGSERVLAVVARRPGWYGVLSESMPNSRAGWIPQDAISLRYEPYTLFVDLSARRLVVRHDGRVVRRITVAVGRPGTDTPTGRYGVTDSLRVSGSPNGPYGCCAIALTGRQPNVPQGWTGGDRIAIHGTSNEATLGTAASSGCIRVGERDIRWLMERLPLGTTVRVKV
jgi:lipoprotein-anchoring transpeptidase ErfK/SrfK